LFDPPHRKLFRWLVHTSGNMPEVDLEALSFAT
jgi:hypothetical protein